MWRSSDGRFHTVALPAPEDLFTRPALASVMAVLGAAATEDISSLVERMELKTVERWSVQAVDEALEARFVGATPPVGLFPCVVGGLSDLRDALDDVDPRWVLDVAMALDDLSDRAQWTPLSGPSRHHCG